MNHGKKTFSIAIALVLVIAATCAQAGCSNDVGAGGRFEPSGTILAQTMATIRERATAENPIDIDAQVAPEPYAYAQLDEPDQQRYHIVLDAFEHREARDYPDDDMDRLTRIRDCVLADHPKLFDVESVHMETTSNVLTGAVTHVSIEGRFSKSVEEYDEVLQRARTAAAECFADMPAGADDYAKAKRAYEFLVDRIEYDRDGVGISPSPDQTIEGGLVNGRAVCGGYSSAFAYLLQSVGVQCATVSGIGDGVEHAWCVARLDGAYYYIDPTWGDPIDGSLDYDYLAITSADLAKGHEATSPFALPHCTATDDNYYVREGLLFDWADEQRLADAVAAGRNQIRCTNPDTYYALLDGITSGRLANLLGVEQYGYSYSNELMSLKVYLDEALA